MQRQVMEWNTILKLWMVGDSEDSLFSPLFKPFSGRWPISGMMRNGVVFELQMPVHHITDSGSLLSPTLRTPSVTDSTGGAISESQAVERGRMVKVADQVAELAFENGLKVSPAITASLLPTPAVAHLRNHDEPIENYLERRQDFLDGKTKGMPGASLGVAVRMEMMPTPQAMEGYHGNNLSSDYRLSQNRQVMLSNIVVDISAEVTLLPTVQVDDAKNTGHNQSRRTTLASEVWETERITNWGKFAPAIERWERITRVAPAPTKPDGKDGAHRLSAEFTEWMMGLPEGWVTSPEIGLKRNEQLKACGNGVVPQQAVLALRMLLEGIVVNSVPKGGLDNVLPTPTVMDQRDGKHFRAVALKNLENGKNRGLNLNNVVEAIGVDWQDGDTFTMTKNGLKKNDN